MQNSKRKVIDVTLERISEQAGMVSADHLDRFESIWLSGEIPDISRVLRESKNSLPGLCRSLVELDLEYRWKRYHRKASLSDRDVFGFPLFPRLEDYANLLDESERSQLLTPQLLAEEYRVRRFWGDQPSRDQFLQRLPQQTRAIEAALNQIDTEFEVEGMTPLEQDSAEFEDAESTFLNHVKQPTSEIKQFTPNIGKYELVELLGRGGFGEVWRAYDPHLKRQVALKFPRPDKEFSPDLMDYFRREAEKMAALEQVPGVVPVYEAGEANGVPYIVAFLVEGHNLGVLLKEGTLTRAESVRIVAEVATTLHRAHLNNLFHRDVKLSNILVNREGRVFLSDFGLSVSEEEQLHETYSATGTYAYMSPEQIRAQSHRVDGRADIYSLGVVLYRLLTNRLPYIAETPADYIDQVLHREPRPLRSIDDQIPAELERICLKCLRKPISDRYTTAGDLAEELRSWLSTENMNSAPAPVGSDTSPAQWSAQKRQYVAVFVFFCLLSGGIGVTYFKPWWERSKLDSPIVDNGNNSQDAPGGSDTPGPETEENALYLSDVSPLLRNQGIWEIRERENIVRVFADDLAMKSLGNLKEGGEFRLKIDFQELTPESSVGLFFGMSDESFNSNDGQWTMLILEKLDHERFRISLQHRGVVGRRRDTTPLGERDFDAAANRVSVEITLSPEGLQELNVNGQRCDDLVTKYHGRMSGRNESSGRFGIHCLYGRGVFSNPEVDGTPVFFKEQQK